MGDRRLDLGGDGAGAAEEETARLGAALQQARDMTRRSQYALGMGRQRSYNVWVVVRPASDLPGQWVAQCLDVDVVSQGNSLDHALGMAREALVIVILDELSRGRDPLERRAPDEIFSELYDVLEHGHKISPAEMQQAGDEGQLTVVATQFELRFEMVSDRIASRWTRRCPVAIAQSLAC